MPSPMQSIAATRRDEMFPTLEPDEIARLHRFGEVRRYDAHDALVRSGERGSGLVVILTGRVEVTRHDETGHQEPIVTYDPHGFIEPIDMHSLGSLQGTEGAGRPIDVTLSGGSGVSRWPRSLTRHPIR